MDFGEKLKELNMSSDEINKMSIAFKDQKFREMLCDYAQELSDPENKKRYEEEIKLLEQERGNTIEFIHPVPFKVLRTSVNGRQKCFINICGNEKVGKPSSRQEVSGEGRTGHCWSLPHSLHPGRQEKDPKRNKIMIYDVIFHPDTLHIASKTKRFMDMVDSTAIQGIQNSFQVNLDKNNVREIRTKYKGNPQTCVIRKPIPGYEKQVSSEKSDPLAFPYPDEKDLSPSLQTHPSDSLAAKNSGVAEPNNFQIQPQKMEEPTKPNHSVKYRHFIDLQDFRCSRDSGQSPRPKEMVVTIDLPLLKAAGDANLEVSERKLLLESKKPAYRLELPLAYPVAEERGGAKFNKQRGQLTVTLPILPSNEALDFALGISPSCSSDDKRQEENSENREHTEKEKEEREDVSEEQRDDDEEEKVKDERKVEEGTGVEKVEEEEESRKEKGKEQMNIGENCKELKAICVEEVAQWKPVQKDQEIVEEMELKQENEEEVGTFNIQEKQKHEDLGESKHNELREAGFDSTSCRCDTVDQNMDVYAEVNPCDLITPEDGHCIEKEEEVNPISSFKSAPSEKLKETTNQYLKLEEDTAFLHHRSSEVMPWVPADTQNQNINDCSVSQDTEESINTPDTYVANTSSSGSPDDRATFCSVDPSMESGNQEEEETLDEDDLSTLHISQNSKKTSPPVALREIDEYGNEKIISDHSTSAGFNFQNCIMYVLD